MVFFDHDNGKGAFLPPFVRHGDDRSLNNGRM